MFTDSSQLRLTQGAAGRATLRAVSRGGAFGILDVSLERSAGPAHVTIAGETLGEPLTVLLVRATVKELLDAHGEDELLPLTIGGLGWSEQAARRTASALFDEASASRIASVRRAVKDFEEAIGGPLVWGNIVDYLRAVLPLCRDAGFDYRAWLPAPSLPQARVDLSRWVSLHQCFVASGLLRRAVEGDFEEVGYADGR